MLVRCESTVIHVQCTVPLCCYSLLGEQPNTCLVFFKCVLTHLSVINRLNKFLIRLSRHLLYINHLTIKPSLSPSLPPSLSQTPVIAFLKGLKLHTISPLVANDRVYTVINLSYLVKL